MSYLHGYSEEESDRLNEQAQILGPAIYEHIDFKHHKNLLEIGCGTGGQTEYILRHYPHLQLTSIDHEDFQIKELKNRLRNFQQLSLLRAEALRLPLPNESYDGVYFCWTLEHIPDYKAAIQEALRVCRKGGRIYINEVSNEHFRTTPLYGAIKTYWDQYNQTQQKLGGHPFLGDELPALFRELPVSTLSDRTLTLQAYGGNKTHSDTALINYWEELMLSAAPRMRSVQLLNDTLLEKTKKEFADLRQSVNHSLSFSWKQFELIKS